MELATTFRGLNPMESGMATRALERGSSRLERLLDRPTTLRVVVDAGEPAYRVALSLGLRGQDLISEDTGHDLPSVIASAYERLRVQMVRTRHRRESQRHKAVSRTIDS